jgi:hypothetical protein
MHRLVSFAVVGYVTWALTGCGSEAPAHKATRVPLTTERQHDYGSTWVYTVGEVESPTATDCKKAYEFINADADCIGRACKYATTLIQDYQFACEKKATPDEREALRKLKLAYLERTTQPVTSCMEQVETWLDRGCGENGSCEARVQRWATQCSATTQSKLIVYLLERLIENSLHEPRKVKLDSRSCQNFSQNVDEAAKCAKPFDCEDALPKVDEYLLRCAQGPRRAIPLGVALSIAKVRLGAEKPFEPIALTEDVLDLPNIPGTLPLIDKGGIVLKVCDEPVSTLPNYVEQRASCKAGTVTVLTAGYTQLGRVLQQVTVPHLSDEQYRAAYPKLWVVGEREARTETALSVFAEAMKSLPEQAVNDFAGAIAKVNVAFGNVPSSYRQSPKLRATISPLDSSLVPLFSIIASSKVAVAGTRLSDTDFLAFLRRSEALVFSDLSNTGNVEIGATVELSELLTKDALPKAFAAYESGLEKLRKQALKRKLDSKVDINEARAQIAEESRACTLARNRYAEHQKRLETCLSTDEGCPIEQVSKLSSSLLEAKSTWQQARMREIIAMVSTGQPTTSSAVCSSL